MNAGRQHRRLLWVHVAAGVVGLLGVTGIIAGLVLASQIPSIERIEAEVNARRASAIRPGSGESDVHSLPQEESIRETLEQRRRLQEPVTLDQLLKDLGRQQQAEIDARVAVADRQFETARGAFFSGWAGVGVSTTWFLASVGIPAGMRLARRTISKPLATRVAASIATGVLLSGFATALASHHDDETQNAILVAVGLSAAVLGFLLFPLLRYPTDRT